MAQETQRELDARAWKAVTSQDRVIEEMVRQLAESVQPAVQDLGRRSNPRIAYPKLIGLTPLRNDTLQPANETIYVVGKNLAPLGLDFFHHEPIPQRYVLVSLERANESWMRFLMKITWCRFLKPGWYDSGGRFMKVIEWIDPVHGEERTGMES